MRIGATIIAVILLGIFLGFVAQTFAAAPVPIGGGLGDNFAGQPGVELTAVKIFRILNGLACWATRIAIMLIIAALVVYGLQFLFSRGNPAKMQAASRSFWLGIVGIIVILGAYTIISTVAFSIGAKSSPYPILCD